MTDYIRTPENAFNTIKDFPFEPNYLNWHDLRVHYLDEGPKDGPVMLLVHGMPTWSYLYRHMIPPLVAAGYRCIAPDHLGFGRSDKPSDVHWYTVARHVEVLTSLITQLELSNITLVCQDWGGPISLAQAAMMPQRFARLTIMNTWLHHDQYTYSAGIRTWNKHWHEGGLFCRESPNVAALMVLNSGHIDQRQMVNALVDNSVPQMDEYGECIFQGYSAPHRELADEAFNGLRRFPLSIPFDNFTGGNGAAQALHFRTLLNWQKPAHFIWGCADDVFTEAWGRDWAEQMPISTFDPIAEAGHFLQETHGGEIVELLLSRIAQES